MDPSVASTSSDGTAKTFPLEIGRWRRSGTRRGVRSGQQKAARGRVVAVRDFRVANGTAAAGEDGGPPYPSSSALDSGLEGSAPVVVWSHDEAAERLVGHLRLLVGFSERSAKTPASLARKGDAWCSKHRVHLGEVASEDRLVEFIQRAVVSAMEPTPEELALVDLYGSPLRMEGISVINAAATEMVDIRVRVGFGWKVMAAATVAATAGLAITGRPKGAASMATVAVAAVGVVVAGEYGSRIRSWFRRAWIGPRIL